VEKKWLALPFAFLAAALVLYFMPGTTYAAPRGAARARNAGKQNNPPDTPQDVSYADGVVKEIRPGDDKQPAMLRILGKKDGKGKDAGLLFTVIPDTQIFIGKEKKELSDVQAGDKVDIAYSKAGNGQDDVALVVRVLTDKADATSKGGGDAPKGE
jgi:hypothetical protein